MSSPNTGSGKGRTGHHSTSYMAMKRPKGLEVSSSITSPQLFLLLIDKPQPVEINWSKEKDRWRLTSCWSLLKHSMKTFSWASTVLVIAAVWQGWERDVKSWTRAYCLATAKMDSVWAVKAQQLRNSGVHNTYRSHPVRDSTGAEASQEAAAQAESEFRGRTLAEGMQEFSS